MYLIFRAIIGIPLFLFALLVWPRRTIHRLRWAAAEMKTIEAQDVMRPKVGYWEDVDRTRSLMKLAIRRKWSEFNGNKP